MPEKKPFVNLILLNWNNFEDTKECLDSVLKINYNNYGITLTDNFSTDGSFERLKVCYGRVKKIKFLRNNCNMGFAKGNNLAIRKDLFKKSNYFMILNNDTITNANFLSALISFCKDKEHVGVVSPRVYDYYHKDCYSKSDIPGKFSLVMGGGKSFDIDSKKPSKIDYGSGCCWLIKKKVFEKTGGFDENYFAYNEEVELAYRIKKAGYSFYLVPASKIWHKGARTSGKISGLKLHYMNRNIIWFERKYASNSDYPLFLTYYLLYKIPKNLIKILLNQKEITKNVFSLLLGTYEGLFTSAD